MRLIRFVVSLAGWYLIGVVLGIGLLWLLERFTVEVPDIEFEWEDMDGWFDHVEGRRANAQWS